jgi:hypothetical protein
MFGSVRHVFTSRWKALTWALGVLLTAYCSVPSPDPVSDNGGHAQASAKHVNPWAKDYKADAGQKSDKMDFHAMMQEVKEQERRLKHSDDHHENPWAKKPDADGNKG